MQTFYDWTNCLKLSPYVFFKNENYYNCREEIELFDWMYTWPTCTVEIKVKDKAMVISLWLLTTIWDLIGI